MVITVILNIYNPDNDTFCLLQKPQRQNRSVIARNKPCEGKGL